MQLTLNSDVGYKRQRHSSMGPIRSGTGSARLHLTQNITMTHNIVRNTLSPFVINPGTDAYRGLTGNFIMRHNLFQRTDPTVWTNETGDAYIGSTATSSIFFTPVVSGFVMDHNTILASNTAWAVYGDTFAVTYPRDTVITNNIFWQAHEWFLQVIRHPDLASQMCPAVPVLHRNGATTYWRARMSRVIRHLLEPLRIFVRVQERAHRPIMDFVPRFRSAEIGCQTRHGIFAESLGWKRLRSRHVAIAGDPGIVLCHSDRSSGTLPLPSDAADSHIACVVQPR